MSQTHSSDTFINTLVETDMNLAEHHIDKARTLMDEFAQYISLTIFEGSEPLEQSVSQYILSGVTKIDKICRELTTALRYDNNNDTVSVTRLLHRLTAAADFLNLFLRQVDPTHTIPRIVIQNENRNVNLVLENLLNVKCLKEIVVVHDESITFSCDCPICFETVAETSAIYTNCHHGFCSTCIKCLITSVSKSTKEKKLACPMCRLEIIDLKIGGLEVFNDIKNHLFML